MNDTIYKIAIAAFLHDIGKFAERGKGHFNVSQEFLDRHATLYQPLYNGRHTHKHAVYTAAFIDRIEKFLPRKFNKGEWGLGDSFINLAAGHHNPETPLQWIISMADRISSGFDRDEFEDYNKEIAVKDYKKTRLFTIFEGVAINEKQKEDTPESYHFRYPLRELTQETIFPVNKEEYRLFDSEQASKEYDNLFFGFVNSLENLGHKRYIPLWFEHFDSLFMIYASYIPAATVGKVVPDVSLYDHSKATAAIASALYLYHDKNDSLNDIVKIKSYDEKKFLIVSGDFYGIQNFIFTEGSGTNKAAAKLLRGRSFAVSLISELAADMLCRKTGLTISSVILNAAGKFTIIAPNTKETIEKIRRVEEEINKWLIDMFYGEASLGISFVEASADDFVSNKFDVLWERLAKESERKKYTKINLEKYGGAVAGYLEQFNNDLYRKLCPFCGKRPSSGDIEGDRLLGDEKSACRICRDHIYIGTNLVKESRIAVVTKDAEIFGKNLKEPILGVYQVSFDITGKLNELAEKDMLLKYWDISIPGGDRIAKDITAKFINGYVPKYAEDDETEDHINRLLHGEKTEKKKTELFDMIKNELPKSFSHIAKWALNVTDKPDKFKGREALGVLKADVDNLGLIFSCGLKRCNLSRLATLSRQMNHYFSIYLPYVLSTRVEFRDIYTVFAGGDDLFLIGPWNRIIEFSLFLRDSFHKYVCNNNEITLSAGISVNKPAEPVPVISERAEESLGKAKGNGRNSITLFDEAVTWKEFEELNKIKNILDEWMDKEIINNAMLFRLNMFSDMADQEKTLHEEGGVADLEDWECLKWKAMFRYNLARNAGRNLGKDKKAEAIKEVEKSVEWIINYAGAMKIPVWQVIYNRR